MDQPSPSRCTECNGGGWVYDRVRGWLRCLWCNGSGQQ